MSGRENRVPDTGLSVSSSIGEARAIPLVLIAAIGRNGAIGQGNGLPWRLAGDMRHFRRLTMGRPLIVGRRTWQSIGRPLPGRDVIVVSHDASLMLPPGVVLCPDPAEAVECAGEIARRSGATAIMVGGGATLYGSLIGRAQRLEITEVDLAPPADAFFPTIDCALWRETSRVAQVTGPGDDAAFAFVTYERR